MTATPENTQGRIELLPCPFCGERKFSLALTKRNYCQLHGEPSQGFRIACRNDRCVSRPSVVAGDAEQSGGQNKARHDACLAWNTRAEHPTATSPLPRDEELALEVYKLMKGAEPEFEYEKPVIQEIAAIFARHREQGTACPGRPEFAANGRDRQQDNAQS